MVVIKGIWEYNPYIISVQSLYNPCTIYNVETRGNEHGNWVILQASGSSVQKIE